MRRYLLLIVGVIAAMALVATGCGDDSDGGGESDAEKIDAAWTKMSDVKALHTEFDATLTVDGDLSDLSPELADMLPFEMGIKGEADVDQSDEDNIKMDATFDLDIQEFIDGLLESSGMSAGSDEAMGMQMLSSMFNGIKVRIVDQAMYMELMGTWYELNLEDVSGVTDVAPIELEDIEQGEAAENLQCAQDKLVPSAMLKDIEDKGSEEIDGTDTTHYQATLDGAAAVDLIVEVNEECGDQEMTDSDIQEAKDLLDGMIKKMDIGLWIDGDDQVRKMTLDIELDMAAASDIAGSTVDPEAAGALEDMKVEMMMTVQMSNFGEEVDVEAPADAVPFEDILDAFGGLGGTGGDILDDTGGGSLDDFDFDEGDTVEEGTTTGAS